jgi:hypothetical protein
MLKIDFNDLLYFNLLNFYAAHNYKFQTISKRYDLDRTDKKLYSNLERFTCEFSKDGRTYENRNVAGVSFFSNMFYQNSPCLPFEVKKESTPFPDIDTMLLQVVRDRIKGIEGGYVTGGFLKDLVTPMICPVTFYLASNILGLRSNQILHIFLPRDMNSLNQKKVVIANSRTTNTLGAILLGLSARSKISEVIVLKESPFGDIGWGKAYKISIKRRLLSSYRFSDATFLSRDETLKFVDKNVISNDSMNIGLRKDIFLVQRDFILKLHKDGLTKSKLFLEKVRVCNPESVLDLRHKRRQILLKDL